MNPRNTPVDLLFVVAPNSLLLDIAGPAEAFRMANLWLTDHKQPPHFRLRFAAPAANSMTSVGLALASLEPLPKTLGPSTWVVIVGQPTVHARQLTPAINGIAHWLRRVVREPLLAPGTRNRLVTVCSGALIAARAGLMDERLCTTHHDMLGNLRSIAPRARVMENRVFVIDGPVASSAGVTAGIDLTLQLIADECGEALAAAVAEDMVVYLRRSQRDPELSPFLVNRRHEHSAVHRVQAAVSGDPEHDWNMPEMARLGHVTERHLLRLFIRHAGVSPLQFLRTVRLERARQLIERGTGIGRAAQEAGFRSALHMRRAWMRQWGGSPSDALGGNA
ncbi:MAG TPA: helix-turn-helix domain-containing protein [Steroidobacteraceae bacterium]|jgi:transcriptional regulator GlxA family with amidase domain|nr:helix-turn-helix domain-containing protein [Steroidobacteraceae bacterium]